MLFLKLKVNVVSVSVFAIVLNILSKHTPLFFPLLQPHPNVKLPFHNNNLYVKISLDLGLNRVVFEVDCQIVVNAFLNNSLYVN